MKPKKPDRKENSGRMLEEDLEKIYGPKPKEEKCSGSPSPSAPCKE